MRKIQRSIDVVCTFFAGKAPVPHRFRLRDRYDNLHTHKSCYPKIIKKPVAGRCSPTVFSILLSVSDLKMKTTIESLLQLPQ